MVDVMVTRVIQAPQYERWDMFRSDHLRSSVGSNGCAGGLECMAMDPGKAIA